LTCSQPRRRAEDPRLSSVLKQPCGWDVGPGEERWFFNVVCVFTFWLYGVWVLTVFPASSLKLLALLYCCGFWIELLQLLVPLFYSDRLKHDLLLSAVLPLYPLYQVIGKRASHRCGYR